MKQQEKQKLPREKREIKLDKLSIDGKTSIEVWIKFSQRRLIKLVDKVLYFNAN